MYKQNDKLVIQLFSLGSKFKLLHIVYTVLPTCPLHTNNGCGKERRIYLVHGDLRQQSFETTLGFTGPVPADSRQ